MTNHDSSKFLRRADLLANPDISQTNMHINTDKTDLDLLDYLLTPPADGDFYFGQVFPLLSSQGTLEFSPADIIKIGNPTVPKVTRNNKVSKRTRKKDRVPKPESGLSAYKEKDRGIDLGLDPGLDPELAEKRKKVIPKG